MLRRAAAVACALTLSTALPATAGELVVVLPDLTTGGFARVDQVSLVDHAGQELLALGAATDSLVVPDAPVTNGPPATVVVRRGGVEYREPATITAAGARVVVPTWGTTSDASVLSAPVFNAVFQRDHEEVEITELWELANRSDPPRVLVGEPGTLALDLPEGVGTVDASIGQGATPERTRVVPAGDGQNFLEAPVRPGLSRLVLRYRLPYPGEALQWSPRMPVAVTARSVLVSPDDIEVEGPGLVLGSRGLEGFAILEGGPLEAGDEFAVSLSGGSEHATDPHAGLQGQGGSPQTTIEIRGALPQGPVMAFGLGLGAVLLVGLGLGMWAGSAPPVADTRRRRLIDLEDEYLSGRIDGTTFEARRAELLAPAREG